MRFEVVAAFALGVLLPVLETVRRGITYWTVDFTTMFEDYLGGALLLTGAWAVYRSIKLFLTGRNFSTRVAACCLYLDCV